MIPTLTHAVSGPTLASEVADNTPGVDESNAELEHLRNRNRELEKKPLQTGNEGTSTKSGVLNVELEKLRKDNARFESYTDELRVKLQDRIETTRDSTAIRQKLESNLVITSQMITELTSKLTNEQESNRKLLETNETLRADFERERRQIQFELGAAQQTIADQDLTNQQLVSDLIDNQGYRQALETHLSDLEKENAQKIKKLEKKLADAEAKPGEHEHKLRVKDGTIADLMQELANQSSKLNFTGELESALQKIDGHRPQKSTVPRKCERVTRQLIESADGQELRFPLFRKRLSIGRTRHNDIQLDLRFVSRRHAVIATDDNATCIIDWGSRNGVYVNKKRITEKVLKSGDVITIGLTHLRYEERTKR